MEDEQIDPRQSMRRPRTGIERQASAGSDLDHEFQVDLDIDTNPAHRGFWKRIMISELFHWRCEALEEERPTSAPEEIFSVVCDILGQQAVQGLLAELEASGYVAKVVRRGEPAPRWQFPRDTWYTPDELAVVCEDLDRLPASPPGAPPEAASRS